MELDDLKQAWKNTPEENNLNTNIMEMIQHKSYGPVAALKRVYKKQILFLAAIPFILVLTNLPDLHSAFTSIMFWSYVAFCVGMILFARYNYRVATKMEEMDILVKDHLEQYISVLEKRAKLELIVLRCVMLYFITLAEVVPYLQHFRSLDGWHSLPAAVRFGAYAGLLLLQYVTNRRMKEMNVGRHLRYLKQLLGEM
jgi:hypothetical protein